MVEEICYICQKGILEHEHSELLACLKKSSGLLFCLNKEEDEEFD